MNSKELWIFLFLIGLLLFNWPLLFIFRISLPLYLFIVWGLFIITVGLFINTTLKKKAKDV
ncbi:MAG: hypothetical protein A2X59_11500 [Nitrospirae bacterium GWC2_42_7]|nr:MAG: hypothetical protein A2X59_11500 [Nitrospirae bacterium GWC2_42_7]